MAAAPLTSTSDIVDAAGGPQIPQQAAAAAAAATSTAGHSSARARWSLLSSGHKRARVAACVHRDGAEDLARECQAWWRG